MPIRTTIRVAALASLMLAGLQMANAQQRAFQPVRPGVDPAGPAPAVNGFRNAQPGVRGVRDRDNVHPGRILQSSVIVGAPVTLVGGTRFGTISDFVISDSGCIDYAVVSYNHRLVAIPWGVADFNVDQRALLVDIPRERIAQIPTFSRISELSNGQFSQRVHTFFRGTNRPDMHRGAPRRGEDGNRGGERTRGNEGNRGQRNPGAGSQTPGAGNNPGNRNEDNNAGSRRPRAEK